MPFRENLTPKLLAVLLALVVYAHVSTEREHQAVLSVPLRVARLPEGLVVDAPQELTAKIRARGKQKLFWKLKLKTPEIVVDLAGVRPGQVQRKISPGDVQLPVGIDLDVIEVLDPRMVVFAVDTMVTRHLPVRVPLTGTAPESYRIGTPRAVPAGVQVRGPLRVLGDLDTLATDPVDLTQIEPDRPLQLPIDFVRRGVTLDPASVTVEIPVRVLQTRSFSGVVVRTTGLPPTLAARLRPDLAQVSIRAEVAILDSLAGAGPEVQVDLTGFAPGRHLVVGKVVGLDPRWEVSLVRPDRFMVEVFEEIP